MRQGCLIHTVGRGRKEERNPAAFKTHHKHTATRRPRPTRHGVQRNNSNALAECSPACVDRHRVCLFCRSRRAFTINSAETQDSTQQTDVHSNSIMEASTHPAMESFFFCQQCWKLFENWKQPSASCSKLLHCRLFCQREKNGLTLLTMFLGNV